MVSANQAESKAILSVATDVHSRLEQRIDRRPTTTHSLQLDSSLPSESGDDEWLWSSRGIAYFWCDACAISVGHIQCT